MLIEVNLTRTEMNILVQEPCTRNRDCTGQSILSEVKSEFYLKFSERSEAGAGDVLINRPYYSAHPLMNEHSNFFHAPPNLLLVCVGLHRFIFSPPDRVTRQQM